MYDMCGVNERDAGTGRSGFTACDFVSQSILVHSSITCISSPMTVPKENTIHRVRKVKRGASYDHRMIRRGEEIRRCGEGRKRKFELRLGERD